MKLVHRVLASLAILGLSSFAGCGGTSHGCTEIGCADGVSIELAMLASKYMSQLPLTVKVCTGAGGASCITLTVKTQPGQSATCEVPAMAGVGCFVGPNGTVNVQVPPSAADLAAGKVDVQVTVTDAMSMKVFDQTTPGVVLEATMPNGPGCEPTCHEGSLKLTP